MAKINLQSLKAVFLVLDDGRPALPFVIQAMTYNFERFIVPSVILLSKRCKTIYHQVNNIKPYILSSSAYEVREKNCYRAFHERSKSIIVF